MKWLAENYVTIGLTLGAIDIVLGGLPDSVTKYPGALLKIAHKLFAYGKENMK